MEHLLGSMTTCRSPPKRLPTSLTPHTAYTASDQSRKMIIRADPAWFTLFWLMAQLTIRMMAPYAARNILAARRDQPATKWRHQRRKYTGVVRLTLSTPAHSPKFPPPLPKINNY